MSAITPHTAIFDLSLLMPKEEVFESKGVKRKSSAMPPPLVRKLNPRAEVQHNSDPFIILIKSIHASVIPLLKAGVLIPTNGKQGYFMVAYLNLETRVIRKFFKNPIWNLYT